jgi:hypothetical protein
VEQPALAQIAKRSFGGGQCNQSSLPSSRPRSLILTLGRMGRMMRGSRGGGGILLYLQAKLADSNHAAQPRATAERGLRPEPQRHEVHTSLGWSTKTQTAHASTHVQVPWTCLLSVINQGYTRGYWASICARLVAQGLSAIWGRKYKAFIHSLIHSVVCFSRQGFSVYP